MEHVVLNSVTGEPVRGEPCSPGVWISPPSLPPSSSASSLPPFLAVCLLVLTHVTILTSSLFPFCSLPPWMLVSTVNKAAWSLFNRGFIMSYFPRSYNPFKQAASSQPVMSASLPACQTLIQPLSQPISQELLWVMARSRAFV